MSKGLFKVKSYKKCQNNTLTNLGVIWTILKTYQNSLLRYEKGYFCGAF